MRGSKLFFFFFFLDFFLGKNRGCWRGRSTCRKGATRGSQPSLPAPRERQGSKAPPSPREHLLLEKSPPRATSGSGLWVCSKLELGITPVAEVFPSNSGARHNAPCPRSSRHCRPQNPLCCFSQLCQISRCGGDLGGLVFFFFPP